MTDLRAELIAELERIYFSVVRKGSMAEDMADAVLEIVKRWSV